jgi:bile acid-coenzyme A ligase
VTEQLSYGARLADLAARRPDAPAIHEVVNGRTVTYAELDADAHRVAGVLHDRGVRPGDLVAVALPDCALHAAASFGAWRLGACVLPLSPRLPVLERSRLLAVATELPRVVTLGRFADGAPVDVPLDPASVRDLPVHPRPDVVAHPALAIGSGGTSGTPKITLDGSPGVVQLEDGELVLPPLLRAMGGRTGQTRLVCTPLYHVNGFSLLTTTLLSGDPLVLLEQFDPAEVLEAIAKHHVGQIIVVPTVLQRLAQAPEFASADLSSLEAVGYGGSHCP